MSTLMVGCLEIRDRLVDFVLGGLGEEEARSVSRHLEWCAGCRKELGELQEGIAAVGWALDPVPAPEELEEKVVEAVAEAAGARRRDRRRFRFVTAVAVAATFLAVAAVGWAAILTGRLGSVQAQEVEASRLADELRAVQDAFGGQQILAARLYPTEGHTGGGRVLAYISGGQGSDGVLVIAGGLAKKAGPYTAYVGHPSGVEVRVGRLVPSSAADQLSAYRFDFAQDLVGFDRFVVRDPAGTVILTGTVRAQPAG